MKAVYILWIDDFGDVHKNFVDVVDVESLTPEELKIVESRTGTKLMFQSDMGAYFLVVK